MKVIFLDIDGVLNSRIYDRTRSWIKQEAIDETRLPLVKRIVDETGARIVLSSTWREDWEQDPQACGEDGVYINAVFGKYALSVYDKTPDLGRGASRKDEVKRWIDDAEEQVGNFVIIDDTRYAWEEYSPFFVKTNPHLGRGLEEEHVRQAIEILNRPNAE